MAATLRKRTRRGTAATSDAVASEDSAAAVETSMAPLLIWAWLSDSDKWMEYSADLSSQITAAMKEGKKSVIVETSTGVKMNILLTAMTQVNASSGGTQREVQCGTPCGTWEREGEDGSWTPFSDAMNRLLTAARLCGVDEVTVTEESDKIPVNMVDLVTDGKERVRCVPTETTTPAVWQWRDKAGAWHRYPPAVNKKLEGVYCDGGRMVTVTGRGFETKVDLWDTANVKRETTSSTGGGTSSAGTTSSAATSTKSNAKKKKAPSKQQQSSVTEEEEVSVMKSKRFTGRAAVDEECTKLGKAHVLCEGDDVWTAMLNQTNLKNNNNKFYMLQLLEDDKKRSYSVWFRWGRVGKTGQHTLEEHGGNLTSAKASFTKKFHDKTNNRWDERNNFIKVPGKYDLLAMDYGSEEGEEHTDAGVKEEEKEKVESKLDQRLQDLISMICNVKAMEDTVKELKYDTKKAPLGKLTTAQIKMGYSALKKIEELINKNTKGDALVRACDQFYTRVPHDFGMRRPPIISTMAEVRQKLALLEALGDIQIAMSILHHRKDDEHPIDTHYHELHCDLTPVDKEDEVFSMVERYVRQTHGKTHTQYSLSVEELFEVDRDGERERFTDVGNRQLLWHGSRLTNWMGILNQGLRVAPPEAPVTGYMFGKGVYFADCSSKSANYCFASPSKSEGLMMLCEVALGKPNELLAADYHGDQLPTGTHCVKGLGRIAPDPAHTHKLSNGCIVPLGLTLDTGVLNTHGYTLNYNEYVVYKPSQILMKYLVKLKFKFK